MSKHKNVPRKLVFVKKYSLDFKEDSLNQKKLLLSYLTLLLNKRKSLFSRSVKNISHFYKQFAYLIRNVS